MPEFRWLIPAVKYSRARTIRDTLKRGGKNKEGKNKKERERKRDEVRMQRFNGWFFHDPGK